MPTLSNEEIAIRLGKLLRKLRTEAGLKQSDVAKLIGRSANVFTGWESGSTSPNAVDLCRLAHVFGVSLDWLVGRPDSGGFLGLVDQHHENIANTSRNRDEVLTAISSAAIVLSEKTEPVTVRDDFVDRIRAMQSSLEALADNKEGGDAVSREHDSDDR